jgi:hypothetical protein
MMTGSAPNPMEDRVPDGPPGLPPWVKLLALGVGMALILLLIVMLVLGGQHGPGMHGG